MNNVVKLVVVCATSLFLIVLSTDVFSSQLLVTRSFTGAWDQINQESQGINLQVIEQADNSKVALAYWYTYGKDKKSAWYLGIGQIIDDHISFDLYHSDGVGFMESAKPGDESVQPIGTMTMSFTSCDAGTVTFDTSYDEVGSGSFEVTRLTDIMNMHCTGGISDDADTMAKFGEQRIDLASARDGINASGHARFESSPVFSQFDVETQGLPDGAYHLYVGGDERGEFVVTGGAGVIKFSSPQETAKGLLTFDPRGMQIKIYDDTGMVLSSFDGMFEHDVQGSNVDPDHNYDCASSPPMGGAGHDGSHDMDECVNDGDSIEISAELLNANELPDAQGNADWEMTSEYIAFTVEIEGVPVDDYALVIGGTKVGSISTQEMMYSDVFGRIMFRDPQLYGGYHLDFDPRGQTIEIMQQDKVILTVDFPTQ